MTHNPVVMTWKHPRNDRNLELQHPCPRFPQGFAKSCKFTKVPVTSLRKVITIKILSLFCHIWLCEQLFYLHFSRLQIHDCAAHSYKDPDYSSDRLHLSSQHGDSRVETGQGAQAKPAKSKTGSQFLSLLGSVMTGNLLRKDEPY